MPECVLNLASMQVPSCTKQPVHAHTHTHHQCFVWNNNEIKSVDLKAGGQHRINFPRRSTTSSWDAEEIEGGSWLRCLCYVPLPVSVRQRRSRLSQRKVWRNSKRKRRKLQRRLRNRPNWSVGWVVFWFFLFDAHLSTPFNSCSGFNVQSCWALWVQEVPLPTVRERLSIV